MRPTQEVHLDRAPAELEARSPYHNAVRLALAGSPSDVTGTLSGLSGVARVEDAGASAWRVVPANGASIGHAVSETCRKNGWEIAELTVERGRLDDVFRSVTRGDVDVPAELQPTPPTSPTASPNRTEEEVQA